MKKGWRKAQVSFTIDYWVNPEDWDGEEFPGDALASAAQAAIKKFGTDKTLGDIRSSGIFIKAWYPENGRTKLWTIQGHEGTKD